MKKTVTLDEFRNDFVSVRPENFSYDGLEFKDGIWKEVKDIDVRNEVY